MTTPPDPTPAPPQPTTDQLWSQLSNAVAFAVKEDQMAWAIFGIFWAAEVLLLGALMVTGHLPDRTAGLVLSTTGVILSLVWGLIEARSLMFVVFYEKVVETLELELLNGRTEIALSTSLARHRFDRIPGPHFRARVLMLCSCGGSLVVWLGFTTWFIFAG